MDSGAENQLKPPTAYQRDHRPTRRLMVQCAYKGELDSHNMCPECGRWLKTSPARTHNPNRDGKFGYVERYADGSTRWIPSIAEGIW